MTASAMQPLRDRLASALAMVDAAIAAEVVIVSAVGRASNVTISAWVGSSVVVQSGGKVPVLGNSQMHQQQNWMADWIDSTVAQGRAAPPWNLGADIANGILALSLKGATPKSAQAWHVWGNPTELYSQVPWSDPLGRSHPYSPETSDDIAVMAADFKVRPPADGPRGRCMPISQATIIPHPTYFPAVDATLPKSPNTGIIPRAPIGIWLRHDALLQFGYANGHFFHVGWIPGIKHSHDGCIDGRFNTVPAARKILYVCDLGAKDVSGKWVGGRIARVDRLPGAVAVGGTPPEDPSKYIVTTLTSAGFPTAVRSDENGTVYFVDGDKAGEITMLPLGGVPVKLCTVPNAFAIDYAAGKLYVGCSTGEVRIVDIETRSVGPDLMPTVDTLNHTAPAGRNVDFFTISVDANGTCGPKGQFMFSRVHTHGNTNSWHFAPNTEALYLIWQALPSGSTQAEVDAKAAAKATYLAAVTYGNQIDRSGQGWNSCGDARYVHELFGHYDWLGGKYHVDQAIQFIGGYANCPNDLLVYDPDVSPGVPAPAQAVVDYTAIWRGINNICWGGPVVNLARPSLTALFTREGWSMFAGCSNDELAEMGFDALEAFIHGGYIGSFRRDDIVGVDLYCVMLFHLVNSQRHIRVGAKLINDFKAWWTGKGRALPPNPAAVVNTAAMGRPKISTHVDGNVIDLRLEVREVTPGNYRIGIFASASKDIRYLSGTDNQEQLNTPIPVDAQIIVDEGMPSTQVGAANLTRGWHAFTVHAAGWNTGAVSYFVP